MPLRITGIIVTTDMIQDGAVTNTKLAANAVTTDKIKNNEVKIEDAAADLLALIT